MIHWSDILARKLKLKVQAFGKLPFYRDYLRWISIEASEEWRVWLLETFSGDEQPSPGLWPFIFRCRPGSPLIIGLMEPGTDGIREFPFSLFVVADSVLLKSKYFGGSILSIWQALKRLRGKIALHGEIDYFNRFIREQAIIVKKSETGPENGLHDERLLLRKRDGDAPLLMIFQDAAGGPGTIFENGLFNTGFPENRKVLRDNHA